MESVVTLFENRKEELDLYFDFLYKVINGSAKLEIEGDYVYGQGRIKSTEAIHSDIIDSLKANGYLLLYNLTESVIRQSLEAIKRKIETQNCSFDDLREELKTFLSKTLKHDNIRAEVVKSCHPSIGRAIISTCFDSTKLINGNVDQKAIKELAQSLGFSSITKDNQTHKGGRELKTVKDKRNDLAHGNYSFIEIGRNTSIDEMIRTKIEVISFLTEILSNIEQYLIQEEYLQQIQALSEISRTS